MAIPSVGTSSPADLHNNPVSPICKSFSVVSNTASGTILTKLACCSLFKITQWIFVPLGGSHNNVLYSPLLGPYASHSYSSSLLFFELCFDRATMDSFLHLELSSYGVPKFAPQLPSQYPNSIFVVDVYKDRIE